MPTDKILCERCGNCMEWITADATFASPTNPFISRGRMACWHCERRASLGLAPLPKKPEPSIEAIRLDGLNLDKQAVARIRYPDPPRYLELTQGIREARKMNAEFNRCRKVKAMRRERGLKKGGWTDKEAHQAFMRRLNAERSRPHWQRKAEQFALGLTG